MFDGYKNEVQNGCVRERRNLFVSTSENEEEMNDAMKEKVYEVRCNLESFLESYRNGKIIVAEKHCHLLEKTYMAVSACPFLPYFDIVGKEVMPALVDLIDRYDDDEEILENALGVVQALVSGNDYYVNSLNGMNFIGIVNRLLKRGIRLNRKIVTPESIDLVKRMMRTSDVDVVADITLLVDYMQKVQDVHIFHRGICLLSDLSERPLTEARTNELWRVVVLATDAALSRMCYIAATRILCNLVVGRKIAFKPLSDIFGWVSAYMDVCPRNAFCFCVHLWEQYPESRGLQIVPIENVIPLLGDAEIAPFAITVLCCLAEYQNLPLNSVIPGETMSLIFSSLEGSDFNMKRSIARFLADLIIQSPEVVIANVSFAVVSELFLSIIDASTQDPAFIQMCLSIPVLYGHMIKCAMNASILKDILDNFYKRINELGKADSEYFESFVSFYDSLAST